MKYTMNYITKIFIFLILLSTICFSQPLPDSIYICTHAWDNYTQKDGYGLYHDLWKEVFSKNNITLSIEYAPFKRCETSVLNDSSNIYDTYSAGYATNKAITPFWHIGIDQLCIVHHINNAETWEDQHTLTNKTVTWRRGYDFHKHNIVTVPIILNEFNDLQSGLKMVVRNRTEYLLDYELGINQAIKELDLSDSLTVIKDAISGDKYYMIFSNTSKGRALATIWDREMQKLHTTGKLHTLYQKYSDLSY